MDIIKVSVILPVYNVEKYLTRCLDSIVNQTLKEIEIICVDDGSTDGSAKILKEYLYKKGLIKVNEAQCIEHSVNQNHLIIKFKLNDEETTRLIVKINLDNNSYEFF